MTRNFIFWIDPRLNLVKCLTVALALVHASAMQAQFEISRYTVDGGGGSSEGGGFKISGTVGQPDAGHHSGGEYEIFGGFWLGEVETATPTPADSVTPTETPTATPIGTYFDVKPDPLDGFIDARDLIEWASRTKEPGGNPGVLFEFSIYWQGDYPPPVKKQELSPKE